MGTALVHQGDLLGFRERENGRAGSTRLEVTVEPRSGVEVKALAAETLRVAKG